MQTYESTKLTGKGKHIFKFKILWYSNGCLLNTYNSSINVKNKNITYNDRYNNLWMNTQY